MVQELVQRMVVELVHLLVRQLSVRQLSVRLLLVLRLLELQLSVLQVSVLQLVRWLGVWFVLWSDRW